MQWFLHLTDHLQLRLWNSVQAISRPRNPVASLITGNKHSLILDLALSYKTMGHKKSNAGMLHVFLLRGNWDRKRSVVYSHRGSKVRRNLRWQSEVICSTIYFQYSSFWCLHHNFHNPQVKGYQVKLIIAWQKMTHWHYLVTIPDY